MSEQSINWKFPGKVLFVDNDYKDVKDIIDRFTQEGIAVQYWNSVGENNTNFDNIRIIVLDLNLTDGQGEDKTELSYYQPAAEVLTKIRGPYLIVILSTDYEDGDIDNLKKAYTEFYPEYPPLQTLGEEVGITKEVDFANFYEKIKNKFEEKNVFKLIIAWEKLLDIAKDKTLHAISKEEFENEINVFIKSIKVDVGDGSLTREFVSNMTRLLSRYMGSGNEYEELSEILHHISEKSNPTEVLEPLLQNMRAFYVPTKDEQIWTGDIFKNIDIDNENQSSSPIGLLSKIKNSIINSKNSKDDKILIEEDEKLWKYKIVLTPACDFSQAKVDNLFVCEGFALNWADLSNKNHPFYKIKPKFSLPESTKDSKIDEKNLREKLQRLFDQSKLKSRYCILKNFRENDSEEYFTLIFDLTRINSIKKCIFEFKENERLSRLDSPYIEDLLQKYGSYSTRLGIPGEETQ